ncbi:MAG: amylo-alpha,6-glucosidase, partial [Candidatus Paceibacter sp.]|nr:amylo-alpha,6-glucosidase [Candidatus Paceibacter sp.]
MDHTQQDLRSQIPDLIPFLEPDEKIVSVEDQGIVFPDQLMDAHEALAHLSKVERVEDIGKAGPPMASIALGKNTEVKMLRMYEAVFGRDSLYMSDHLLTLFPELARVTLVYLASMQGLEFRQYAEEEPGRIAHEIRPPEDPIGQELTKEKGWLWPYYGSIDSTLLFIRVLYRYSSEIEHGEKILEQTFQGRDGKTRTMFEALDMAVRWVETRMDTNPQGFIESKPEFPMSLVIQSLQDSNKSDSLFERNGRFANDKQGIIATEVQGQAYDALVFASRLLKRDDLKIRAEKLKSEIMKFWIEDDHGSYFASGADRDDAGNIRLMNTHKPIAAFILNTELFAEKNPELEQKLDAWVKTLFSPAVLAAGGLRSLPSNEPYYTPVSYHNGSVWPVITYEVARGLRKQGYENEAKDLEDRILRIVHETKLYPEYVRGDEGDTI